MNSLIDDSFNNLVSFYEWELKQIYKGDKRAPEIFTSVFIRSLISKGVIRLKMGYIRTHVLTNKTKKVLRLK
ncbi:hypothetical protein ES702_01429 [subsurface metagenome]